MIKRLSIVASVMTVGLVVAGCSADEGTGQAQEESYIIGLDDTFAPMGFRNDDDELVGFDIELAEAVAEDLGVEFTFQPIDWAMKETELNGGNIDMIWNGYTITDERAGQVAFGTAYMENSQLIITLEGNEIDTKEDLAGKSVAAQQSSSAVDAIESDPSNIIEEFANGEVVQYPSNNEVFNDLITGRSDAIVVDETLGRFYMNQNPSEEYKVLEDNFGEEEYAVGFRKEDDDLRERVNQSLETLMNDGTYEDIYDNWFD